MGHVKLINNTGQALDIKLEREEYPQVKNYESKELDGHCLPLQFDKAGYITKAVITITAKKGNWK